MAEGEFLYRSRLLFSDLLTKVIFLPVDSHMSPNNIEVLSL